MAHIQLKNSPNQLLNFFFIVSFFEIACLHAQLCSHEQSTSLLQFKSQFSFNKSASNSQLCVNYYGAAPYPVLETWKEGTDCCLWDGVNCDNKTSRVIGLDLSCSWLQGSIHPNSSLFNSFPHLQVLVLSFNDFRNSPIPSAFGQFKRLTALELWSSGFSGKVPIEISNLNKLTYLDLSFNNDLRFEKSAFELLVRNLTNLGGLLLSGVSINNEIPNSLLNLTSLESILLARCGLYGKFPDGVFHLRHLKSLDVSENYHVAGYIPKFMNSTTPSSNLQELVLDFTSFSGELPTSIGNLKSMKIFSATGCNFYGPIPPSLGNLTQTEILDLSYNHFNGILPSEINGLPHLSTVWLRNNLINGPIPSWVFTLPALEYLDLSNNKLTGDLNEFQSKSLEGIYLSNNNLRGNLA